MAQAAVKAAGRERTDRLLERERELEAFGKAFDRLAVGAGSLVLVEGAAGIGKTRLLSEAVGLAEKRRFLVRTARAGQLEREMPFGVARQLLEPVIERASAQERSRLLAGSAGMALIAFGREDRATPDLVPDPFAPIHGLYWLVANLAEQRPCVLVVDDAHWSDSHTLRWCEYLARRLTDVAVLVIAGIRSGEPSEPVELQPLRMEAEVLRPAPLSSGAVDALIGAQLSQPTSEFSIACARVTGGNPFLLAEVIRTLRADAIEPGAAAANAISALGPESVARYVLMRLGRFGDEAIALARAIAVLGSAPQLRHAAELAGLEQDQAAQLCDRLREAEILAPALPIEFVHPLVRSSIYTEQPEGERSAAHRRAAGLLHDAGTGAGEIAQHLLACAPNGDQWLVGQLGLAAWEAIRSGAVESARVYLERALEEPPDDELPFLYGLGKCLIQTDLPRAPELLGDVADRAADRGLRIGALRYKAMAQFIAGNWDEAANAYGAALEELAEEDRERRLVLEPQLYCVQVSIAGRDERRSRRIETAAAGSKARTSGECLVRQGLAFDRFLKCAPVDEVVELAGSFPPPPWDLKTNAPVLGFAVKVLAWSGSWDTARDQMLRMNEWFRELGTLIGLSYGTGFLAEIDRLSGRLADSEAEARTALEIAAEVAPSANFGHSAITNLIATLIARGNLEKAAQLAKESGLSAGMSGTTTPWPIEVRGYLRLAQGATEDGVEDLMTLGEELERIGFANPAISPWRQESAWGLATLGRTAEGKRLITEAEHRARAFGAGHIIGAVLRSRALLESRKRGVGTLRESVSLLEATGPPHELARSLVELGAALRRDGRRSESREPLRRALEVAHRCGCGGVEARAREELAAAGSRPRRVFRTGVASLTASELRTAKLAAEGLSNIEIAQRLFVSKKTVEKHLGNVYGKLEIDGRNQLPEALEDPVEEKGQKK